MKFSVLSSGSKANCTLLESDDVRVLIDCGLSAKQTELRLQEVGVSPASISAILITHEHSDHIAGLDVFARRHRIPVYLTQGTLEAYNEILGRSKRGTLSSPNHCSPNHCSPNPFERRIVPRGASFAVGTLEVSPFAVSHDAAEPVGYRFSQNGIVFVQCTDLGRVTQGVRDALKGAHGIVLEANHDEDLLRSCEYPWEVKERILSNQGHLSNHTSGHLLSEILHSDLLHVVLGHLSEHSNRPDVALSTIDTYLPQKREFSLGCASIHHALPLVRIDERLTPAAFIKAA